MVDTDQAECEAGERAITYFAVKEGLHGRYWVLNELDTDTRMCNDMRKVDHVDIDRRGRFTFN